jgi:hypothetical protein
MDDLYHARLIPLHEICKPDGQSPRCETEPPLEPYIKTLLLLSFVHSQSNKQCSHGEHVAHSQKIVLFPRFRTVLIYNPYQHTDTYQAISKQSVR